MLSSLKSAIPDRGLFSSHFSYLCHQPVQLCTLKDSSTEAGPSGLSKYLHMSLENVSKLVNLKNEKIVRVGTKQLPTVYRNKHKNRDCLPL